MSIYSYIKQKKNEKLLDQKKKKNLFIFMSFQLNQRKL